MSNGDKFFKYLGPFSPWQLSTWRNRSDYLEIQLIPLLLWSFEEWNSTHLAKRLAWGYKRSWEDWRVNARGCPKKPMSSFGVCRQELLTYVATIAGENQEVSFWILRCFYDVRWGSLLCKKNAIPVAPQIEYISAKWSPSSMETDEKTSQKDI